ncbi:hypothetical protein EZV62_004829 [Acer yangbiense]|uniref:DJ-1/PfpI domain-containing protein n=1 Tax=Acer yangbiense TaxID=1000413 RepID=A0A5C7IM19_9ROSI|nr:hypothetical protein EZV62_004829 [Acer yangbiense]
MDYMEDYEITVPFQPLEVLECHVDAVCPNKIAGDICPTAVHDFEGDQTYSEKPGKLIASISLGQQILSVAGVLKGKKCTAYPTVKLNVVLSGATWLEPDPIDRCFTDGNLVTGAAWQGHPEFISQYWHQC